MKLVTSKDVPKFQCCQTKKGLQTFVCKSFACYENVNSPHKSQNNVLPYSNETSVRKSFHHDLLWVFCSHLPLSLLSHSSRHNTSFCCVFIPPPDPGNRIKHLETTKNEVSSFLFQLFHWLIPFIPLTINPNEPREVVVSAVLDMFHDCVSCYEKIITKRKLLNNFGHRTETS